jgi:signal transduction histidine kinase
MDAASAALLIVDDHPPNLLALEAVLRPLPFEIVAAGSGAEALRLARERDFVLVIMDVHMPGLDGYETVELLRAHERSSEVPIMFLTAVSASLEDARKGYAQGAVDYVIKPFDPEVMRAKVKALVSLYTRGQREERARRDERDKMKDLFLGAVGHDLRNPLNALTLAARMMSTAPPCGVDAHEKQPPRIERAVWRMVRIVEDLLDLTRDKFAGGIPVEAQPVDLADVCRAAVDELRIANPESSIDLQVAGDACGEWDAGRIARVVSNLAANAIRHGARGAARVRLRGDADGVTIAVHNEGPPIAAELLPHLFEPFRRGDTSSHGLGLGLYIVRETVRAHGGSVEVASTAADGTTFTVTLPKRARSSEVRTTSSAVHAMSGYG